MLILKYEGEYNKDEFYKVMGKYFAEPKYQKEMPYMSNKPETTWFVMIEEQNFSNVVVGFGSVSETKNKIIFESSFVEEPYRNNGYWKQINEERFSYALGKNKPIEVITKEEYLKNYWITKGFKEYRKNGRYVYLRKDVEQ